MNTTHNPHTYSRRFLAAFTATLAVAMLVMTPGKAHAMDGDREVTHLRVRVVTGSDDLRKASNAFAEFSYTVTINNQVSHHSISQNLNNGANWPNGSTRTVEIALPLGVLYGNMREFAIRFQSGQSNPFETGDNWNLNDIRVTAILDDGTEAIIVQDSGNPYHRFKSDVNTRRAWVL
ncbi:MULTISPECIES: hypothetical protein [Myxococcus]|uniref:PLAT domain-containing protein n=1 Tax=Myxococcus xanthus TaxID=34 RepID=A0AAE6G1X2_MYXXA|nr:MULTISPECIES: hypothetical protein [Myxococcus]QDE69196.1 hypothetical protein BHS09_20695 [Myxococcus xanthus]QDE76472.1 hypothetical protein BHS08_20710 [Myxococcus xanthus]QDE83893.1 hypothetical protein BHS07_21345 [Myxococcus xanthus]QDE98039.1 hypothetical protein BHS05_20590 [Myxococcus xanthus]QDF05744.1 hypothetical protein BHS04_21430 [Myxococcus xanthus]